MVATTHPQLTKEEATALRATADVTTHRAVVVLAVIPVLPLYAPAEATVAGRETLLALPLVAVAVTNLLARGHPLAVASDRPALPLRVVVTHLVAPPLLAVVPEDVASRLT